MTVLEKAFLVAIDQGKIAVPSHVFTYSGMAKLE